MRRPRQDLGWPGWPLAVPLGWVGDAARGDREQSPPGTAHSWCHIQRHPRAVPTTFNSLLAPAHTHPAQPALQPQLEGVCCVVGSCQQVLTIAEDSSCHRHEPPAFHIKAKRDSPNLRPPQHCLHKSSAYFCIKSTSFQSYSNARNKRLLWLHVILKDRWRRAQCLCWIQMSAEIIPVIPNWCCICL